MTGQALSVVEEYHAQVLPEERARTLFQSMPSHIKPAVFERNLMNALAANPDLMKYHPGLIYREVAKAAALGLLLDPLLGEGYIVTAYNYKSKQTEPQLRVGYKGMSKLARQSGEVTGLYAHEVYSLDHVEADLGFPKVFHHKPKLFGNRGEIIGYVAVITFKDGTFDFEPMSVAECHAIRDRSDAWKAYKDKKIKSTPWSTDDSEMSKKTVIRRLLKRQNQSPEMVQAQRIEDEADFPDMAQAAPARIAPSAPSAPPVAPQIENQQQTTSPEPEDATILDHPDNDGDASDNLPTPSELAQQFIGEIKVIKTQKALTEWLKTNRPTLDKFPDNLYNQVSQIFGDKKEALKKPAKADKADPISSGPQETKTAPASDMPDPNGDIDTFVAWATARLKTAKTVEELDEIFNKEIETNWGPLFPPDREEILGTHRMLHRNFEP